MGIEYKENTAVFSGMIYEDTIVELRDFLQEKAPEPLVLDLSGCDDIHLGVVQLLLAYAKIYEAQFVYPEEEKVYSKLFVGFDRGEEYCG